MRACARSGRACSRSATGGTGSARCSGWRAWRGAALASSASTCPACSTCWPSRWQTGEPWSLHRLCLLGCVRIPTAATWPALGNAAVHRAHSSPDHLRDSRCLACSPAGQVRAGAVLQSVGPSGYQPASPAQSASSQLTGPILDCHCQRRTAAHLMPAGHSLVGPCWGMQPARSQVHGCLHAQAWAKPQRDGRDRTPSIVPLATSMTQVQSCRRSAVERQACGTIACLGSALRARFQAAAVQLLPHLFRAMVLSIQARAILYAACSAHPQCQSRLTRTGLACCLVCAGQP